MTRQSRAIVTSSRSLAPGATGIAPPDASAPPGAVHGSTQTKSFPGCAEVLFEHTSDSRFNTGTGVQCGASGPGDFPFSVDLYPGTYKVTVRRPSYSGADTNLPGWSTVVTTALRVP